MSANDQVVNIDGKELKLTNLNKPMFPGNITKGHVIKYYNDMAAVLLPHIYNRPLVLKRYPHGILGQAFYQKECPAHAPPWIETFSVDHTDKTVNYVLCNNLPTLIWLANLGCLEIHAWTSTIENIEHPNIAVMDLDPGEGIPYSEVVNVAKLAKKALNEFDIECFPKTSGSRGMHLFIPILPNYTFSEVTGVMKYIAEIIEKVYPTQCTTERVVEKRGNRIYLDYLQNTRGKTMAWQYSLRPNEIAMVSTPVKWEEMDNLDPQKFNLNSIIDRVNIIGDLYSEVLSKRYSLDLILGMVK